MYSPNIAVSTTAAVFALLFKLILIDLIFSLSFKTRLAGMIKKKVVWVATTENPKNVVVRYPAVAAMAAFEAIGNSSCGFFFANRKNMTNKSTRYEAKPKIPVFAR